MPECPGWRCGRGWTILALFWLGLGLGLGGPAQAHKVVASAWVEGTDLVGEIAFSNGKPAPSGMLVEVFVSAGLFGLLFFVYGRRPTRA